MKIKKQTKRAIVITGIFCILFLAVSIWYAVRYQNSRLVVPMDFSTYTFQTGDLPMILSVSMICLYGLSLAGWLCIRFWKVRKQQGSDYTRTLNPRLGYLGLLGFLGFGGFWTYALNGEIFPFLFFSFFGFFGFFYEGRLSDTFMDERFQEEVVLAERKAYRISNSIMFLGLLLLCRGKLFGNLEYTLIAVVIVFSLAFALQQFLREYLLYRYDHDSPCGNDGE